MRKQIGIITCLGIFAAMSPLFSWADAPAKVIADGYDELYENGEITANKLLDLKAAALNYYSENDAWPGNVTDLAVDGFYYGNYDTMYGTTISGTANANSYELTIDVLKDSVATYIASFMNGSATDSVVKVEFGLPSQAPILDSQLGRKFNGDVTQNTMETTLYMDGNNIQGIGTANADRVITNRADITNAYVQNLYGQMIDAPVANLTTVNATTVNADRVNSDRIYGSVGVFDNGQRVFSPVNLPTKNDVGLGRVQNYSITNSYTGNRADLYASQRAVYNAYVALDNAKLDKGATAQNAQRLDNLDSSAFIRSNAHDNVYAHTEWQDNREIRLGSSADLRLEHTGAYSRITNYTGDLYLQNRAGGQDIHIQGTTTGGARRSAFMVDSGSNVKARVLYNGSTKLVTQSDGVSITGNASASGDINAQGDIKVRGKKIDKDYVDLGKVMNYSITNSYTGGSSNLYASQRAVTRAYNALNSAKLGRNEKAADADKLDGINSSGFVRTSRRINGHYLSSNVNLDKEDIGLSRVHNYSPTNSYKGDSTQLYATQHAVNDAYKAALSKNSNTLDKGAEGYWEDESTGFTIQWGYFRPFSENSNKGIVYFPKSFDSRAAAVQLTTENDSNYNEDEMLVDGFPTSRYFRWKANSDTNQLVFWTAYGY